MTTWGIYVHSPFCPYKCTYCDFDAGFQPKGLSGPYVGALCLEVTAIADSQIQPGDHADSLYFGGGTPTLFTAEELRSILGALESAIPFEPDSERTIETIPEAIDREKAEALRSFGFNRVSIGAETFNEKHLRMLGRTHSAESVGDACRMLRRAGIKNLNLDLIVGLPGQSLEDWNNNLDHAFGLRPEHISMYVLEVHKETELGRLVEAGSASIPEDELVAEMYETLQRRSGEEGYLQYEISNFALPGFASAHNLKYWSDQPYLGFGSSAHSYDLQERWKNVATPARYVDAVTRAGEAVETRSVADMKSRFQEAMFLGLRKTDGIDLTDIERRFGLDPSSVFASEIETLMADNLVEMHDHRLKLTPHGMLLSNEVFVHFV